MVYLAELYVCATVLFRTVRICALIHFWVLNSIRKGQQCNLSAIVNFLSKSYPTLRKNHFDENADKNLSAVVHFSVEYLSVSAFKPQNN